MKVHYAVASVVCCLLVLVGCDTGATSGDGPDGGHGDTAVAPMPQPTTSASAHDLLAEFHAADQHSAAVTTTVTTADRASRLLGSGGGAYRSTPSGVDLRMSMSVDAQALTARTSKPRTHVAVPTEPMPQGKQNAVPSPPARQHFEMVLLGDNLYLKLPGAHQRSGKPWLKLDPDGGQPAPAAPYSVLARSVRQHVDAGSILKRISAAGTIRKAANTTLHGQPVTHYGITMNTTKALDTITNPQLLSLATKRAKAMPKDYPLEIWVTPNGLPMKVVTEQPMPGVGPTTVELDFSKWGLPTSITAPPVDQVVDGGSG